MGCVGGGDGEIALFVAGFVTQVAPFFFPTGVPTTFDTIGKVVAGVFGLAEANVIEEEKFSFWPKINGVGNARTTEILCGFVGDRAGVAVVPFPGARLLDATDHAQGRFFAKRVDNGSVGVGNHAHIGFINRFPPPDTGAIKGDSVGERSFV